MKPRVLLQLDGDPQPSVFDAIVAVDSSVEHLLRHGAVTPDRVTALVHGCLFTRGLDDLKSTAIFVGGSDVAAAAAILTAVKSSFFGPFRVSTLFDPNGCNTTAAAAVMAVLQGLQKTRGSSPGAVVTVLAGTGPVGQRVARLLSREPDAPIVRIGSRDLAKARAVADTLKSETGRDAVPCATRDADDLARAVADADAIVSAGAAGVRLLPASVPHAARVLVDLSAVPPSGIEIVDPRDRATDRNGPLCWGALGVGATKMKIHKQAIRSLFESNDKIIDAEECLAIGRALPPT